MAETLPPRSNENEYFVDQGLSAVLRACDYLVNKRNQGTFNPNKNLDGGFYDDSITDKSSEIITTELRARFPNHTIISDRKVAFEGNPDKVLMVDPIDGTIGYIRHLGDWGVSLVSLEKSVPEAAVIRLPDTDKTFTAIRGKGAFLNGKQIHVNTESDLKTEIVSFDFGVKENRLGVTNRIIGRLKGNVRQLITLACSSVQLASVAEGGLVAFIHKAYPQDLAAGYLLVTEAGGKITHQDGSGITASDWSKNMMDWIASNGTKIHDEIIDRIRRKNLEDYAKNWRHRKLLRRGK